MPESPERLESLAIEAALRKDWKEAVELNKKIIDYDDQSIPALNRLAKAYLELEKYDDAKKILRKVLRLDPINQTAKKNFEFAHAHRKVLGALPLPDIKNFIKEPGTTKEFSVSIMSKGLTSKKFYLGEPLEFKTENRRMLLYKKTGELVTVFDPAHAERLLSCLKKGGLLSAYFLSGEEKEIKVLVKSSVPLFASEKQEVKPYIKRDTLEEPELELPIPETED